ncbi:MAG: proteasome subunit beta [Promethearchaeota archaeon]
MKTIEPDVALALGGNSDLKILDLFKPKGEKRQIEVPVLKTGTTTVGATFSNGVVLATDKRATMGAFVANKEAQKLNKVKDYIWMTIAGGVADAQALIDIVRAQSSLFELQQKRKIPVKSATRILSNILFQNKFTPYEVGLIVGGITEEEGPRVYDLGAYGSILPEKYCSTGSGSVFALGVLESRWKEGMTAEECKAICVDAVRSAVIRDIASGNGIEVVVVTLEGAEVEFIPISKK